MLVEKSAVSCDEVNRIQLQLLDWGHACTAREWVGDIRDPAYARLYYICDRDPYIVFAGHQLPLQPGWWHLLPGGFSFRHACRSRMEQLYFHIQLVDDTGVNLLRRTDGFLSRRGDPELARSMAKALQGAIWPPACGCASRCSGWCWTCWRAPPFPCVPPGIPPVCGRPLPISAATPPSS